MAILRDNWIILASAVAVVVVLALLWGIWWVWWRLPQRQVARLSLKIRDPKARADVEDNFRKTVGQALGGAAVLIGAGAAYLQFTQQQQTATQQIIAQQKIASDQIAAQQQAAEVSRKASQDLLISNQVSKGFEQLASDKLTMRLGGIYALEGVMNGSAQYHQAVLEALCAFVRDGTIGMIVNDTTHQDRRPSPKSAGPPPSSSEPTNETDRGPATDIQAALTVIGRRANGPGEVNLVRADLSHAILLDVNLSGADLSFANLRGVNLIRADLSDAILPDANLSGALLNAANLSGAYLGAAKLTDAFLIGANLTGADLTRADLKDANLSYATLTGAKALTQEQLDQACGTGSQLPPGLTLKPCLGPPIKFLKPRATQ